ncbi:hypothetical protein TcasGA2_TC003297 [Tribolium castaneum]|uniref:Uncharacterized protein n=1 Tax=Tribolium castaneum TaxID=7070 RepID=D6WEV9_TRICA|nr:hypothetical protein TcasGA2_TC003297 [Tribolium castaneum]
MFQHSRRLGVVFYAEAVFSACSSTSGGEGGTTSPQTATRRLFKSMTVCSTATPMMSAQPPHRARLGGFFYTFRALLIWIIIARLPASAERISSAIWMSMSTFATVSLNELRRLLDTDFLLGDTVGIYRIFYGAKIYRNDGF